MTLELRNKTNVPCALCRFPKESQSPQLLLIFVLFLTLRRSHPLPLVRGQLSRQSRGIRPHPKAALCTNAKRQVPLPELGEPGKTGL